MFVYMMGLFGEKLTEEELSYMDERFPVNMYYVEVVPPNWVYKNENL